MAGFFLYSAGYIGLKFIQNPSLAYVVVTLSHMGGAMVWVFSSTLLQLMTDDKFRGRVFAAELSFCTIVLAITAYLAGVLIDRGVDVRTIALATGALTAMSGVVWAWLGVRNGQRVET
ncbi:MAG: hypothetical protein DMG67_01735 [Acidobacteria bacterium]|nr:MAG: hypothetical protein DMG67_01735 [Acidobacteriota bacterium]